MKKVMYVVIVLLVLLIGFSFYAHYTKEKNPVKEYVTIKFDTDEGSEIPDKKIEKGEKLGTLDTPKKAGYNFLYWTFNDEKVDENYVVNNDITLKATYEEITLSNENYTIAFNTNGGTEIKNQIIRKGEKVVKPEDPVKKGYIFIGWTYKYNPYDFNTPVTSDLALVAEYKLDNSNDKKPPVLTLKGKAEITLKLGTIFEEPGYTAIDDYDGDITNKVVKTGEVDSSKVGEYTITYTVEDEKGNSISKTRIVKYVEE